MFLKSITISNWRCILDEIKIGPFDERINILHAPNAKGKSSLFEALQSALLENHNSKNARLREIQPWGRSLSPSVEVEFFHEGEEYRINKRFLDDSHSLLHRKENGEFRRIAESVAADNTVRGFFSPAQPGRGTSRPDWGMLSILWVPQGELKMKPLGRDLLSAVKAGVSEQMVDGLAAAFEKRLDERYSFFFTDSGKYKRTSSGRTTRLVFEKEELSARIEMLERSMQACEEFDELSKNIGELQSVLETLRGKCEAFGERKKIMKEKTEGYGKLLAERKNREEAEKSRKSEFELLNERVKNIEKCAGELRSMSEKLKIFDGEQLPETRKKLELLEKAHERIIEEGGTQEEEKRKLSTLELEKKEADVYVSVTKDLFLLEKTIESRREAENLKREMESERQEKKAPGAEEMRSIRSAFLEFQNANSKLEAIPVVLEITPSREIEVRDMTSPSLEVHTLPAGEAVAFEDTPEVVLEVESLGTFRTYVGSGNSEGAREAADAARTRFLKLVQPYGTSDMEELERRAEEALQLERKIARQEGSLMSIGGGKPLALLLEESEKSRKQRDKILVSRPEWEHTPPSPDSLEENIESLRSSVKKASDEYTKKYEGARRAAEGARLELQLMERDRKNLLDQIETTSYRLEDIQRDGLSRTERLEKINDLALRWDTAKIALKKTDDEISKFGENPKEALLAIEAEEERELTRLTGLEHELIRLQTRLEVLQATSPFSVASVQAEEVEELATRIEKEERAAEAIRLLKDSFEFCKKERQEALSAPLEKRTSAFLARIFGRQGGEILLDDTLNPKAFRPTGQLDVIGLDNLSGGEGEQLHFACRLSLAEVLSEKERQLVVFDDILMATDKNRLESIIGLLRDMDNLQILVLTCQPERFRSLSEEAKWFDFERHEVAAGN